MRKRLIVIAVVALFAMAVAPAAAYAIPFATNFGVSYDSTLTNDFGLAFAGQAKCVECHNYTEYGNTYHGEFTQPGLRPTPLSGTTAFTSGAVPGSIAGTSGSAPAFFVQGGTYPVAGLGWVTLGAFKTGATEYIFFNPSVDAKGVGTYWNLVEGMIAEPGVGYELESLTYSNGSLRGMYDVKYGCGACHQLGYQDAAADGTVNPNTHFTAQATSMTPTAWAMEPGADKTEFNSWVPGMGIACENCHGTGVAASAANGGHWNAGVKVVGANTVGSKNSIIDSQVCGQCHGAGGKKVSALSRATVGYTPDQNLLNWLDLFAVSGGVQSYNYIPTEAEFAATPSKYRFYPNGANYNLGSHMYYTEWATTPHSYRPALTSTSPEALPYQKSGASGESLYGDPAGEDPGQCYYCHSGEGYMFIRQDKVGVMESAVEDYGFTYETGKVGFAGVECVVCHTGHPGAEGIPGGQEVLREPDQAGEGSAVGRPANSSICEDCHNWRNEVRGTTLVPVVSGRPAVHYPQREVLHGDRGIFFETAAADEFMPDVKCEECHAVMANSSANRPTHSFKIMLPGDAERWDALSGVTVGQDSCSKCHAESRLALQDYVDEWQGEAAALSTELNTELTAAKLRSEYSATAGTAGQYLAAVAYVNNTIYNNDHSGGVHNPPYVEAGLKAGTKAAKSLGGHFDTLGASSSIALGNMGFVAGALDNGDNTGAADAKVVLYTSGGTWLGETRSDAAGNFAFTVAPTATTAYKVVWQRATPSYTFLTSGFVSINVVAPVVPPTGLPSSITISTNRTSALIGQTAWLAGLASPTPGMVGKNMHVDVKKPGRSYWTYSSNRTIYANTSGAAAWMYKYLFRAGMAKGTYQFKAVYDGPTYDPSVSGVISIVLR